MNAPARLALYGLVLAAVFTAAWFTGGALGPGAADPSGTESSEGHGHEESGGDSSEHEGHPGDAASLGLSIARDGYQLTATTAPATTTREGELSFTVTGPDAAPVTEFDLEHEKELHLIVVRSDGQHFRHVHPVRDADGTWSIPWQWEAAGTYRVIADFVPTDHGEGITLSTAVQVAGDFAPVSPTQQTEASVHGFDVALAGDLVPGEGSTLTLTITRNGRPVDTLEPYLGAFGHLVALRDGDLAYLHVHPHGDVPEADDTSGPEIVFEATAPTPGRYLLFLDFKVDGEVHTAPLVLDTAGSDVANQDREQDEGSNQEEDEEGSGDDEGGPHGDGEADDHGHGE